MAALGVSEAGRPNVAVTARRASGAGARGGSWICRPGPSGLRRPLAGGRDGGCSVRARGKRGAREAGGGGGCGTRRRAPAPSPGRAPPSRLGAHLSQPRAARGRWGEARTRPSFSGTRGGQRLRGGVETAARRFRPPGDLNAGPRLPGSLPLLPSRSRRRSRVRRGLPGEGGHPASIPLGGLGGGLQRPLLLTRAGGCSGGVGAVGVRSPSFRVFSVIRVHWAHLHWAPRQGWARLCAQPRRGPRRAPGRPSGAPALGPAGLRRGTRVPPPVSPGRPLRAHRAGGAAPPLPKVGPDAT